MNGRSFSFSDGLMIVALVLAVYGLLRVAEACENAKPVFIRDWPADAALAARQTGADVRVHASGLLRVPGKVIGVRPFVRETSSCELASGDSMCW